MATTIKILRDAANGQILMNVVDATGAAVAARGSVLIRLAHCQGSDGVFHDIALREVCVMVNGVQQTMLVLGSEPYVVTTP